METSAPASYLMELVTHAALLMRLPITLISLLVLCQGQGQQVALKGKMTDATDVAQEFMNGMNR